MHLPGNVLASPDHRSVRAARAAHLMGAIKPVSGGCEDEQKITLGLDASIHPERRKTSAAQSMSWEGVKSLREHRARPCCSHRLAPATASGE